MREPKPYEEADKTIRSLNSKALKRVEKCKRRLLTAKFDELNVFKEIDTLYSDMDADNRVAFKKLFIDRFISMLVYLSVKSSDVPEDDEIDELAEMYITNLLSEPNDVTHFAYDAEVYRKRDRAQEAINSVPGRVEKQIEIDKALRLWSQTMQQYADMASDGADIEAFKAAGINRVRWNTQRDGKVCKDCDELDGKTYPIDKRPAKVHWRCRCWLSAVD